MTYASQDAWALPLAKRMISRYRSQALVYVSASLGVYDETTGTVTTSELSYPAAGAVVKSGKVERDGVQQGHEVEAWIDHETVPWPIGTNDCLQYLGRRWKITDIESYGSGGSGTAGPVYLTALNGKIIATLDGKSFVVQGEGAEPLPFAMYASKVTARAE
jgi:hypothetical protein